MMSARLLREQQATKQPGRFNRYSQEVLDRILAGYGTSLLWVLRHQKATLVVTMGTVILTVALYILIPKGFFPQQDTGQLFGQIQADQSSSFQAMRQLLQQFVTLVGGSGGGQCHRLHRRQLRRRSQYCAHVHSA